jgi:hypothetical protein
VLKFNTLVIANVAKKVNSNHVSKCRIFCSARTLKFYKSDIQRRYKSQTYAKFSQEEKETEMPSSSDNEAK